MVGIVGESGSWQIRRLRWRYGFDRLPRPRQCQRMAFAGQDLLTCRPRVRRRLVGKDIAMVFQDPMTSLNPAYTVGFQIMETLKVHEGGSRVERQHRDLELLTGRHFRCRPAACAAFPHQLSGGMSQRVMIAMAIACSPRLLIADEPTTALDVTIQAQILDLLRYLQQRRGMALLLITHDLAVVAETCERVMRDVRRPGGGERAGGGGVPNSPPPLYGGLAQCLAGTQHGARSAGYYRWGGTRPV